MSQSVVPAKPTGPASGRPDDRLRASRDPYAVAWRLALLGEAFRNDEGRGLWVPAFAGTTLKRLWSFAKNECAT
jgi:predicted nucleic acid-binding Zn ribbon protein